MKGKTHWPSYARRLKKEAAGEIGSGRYPERSVEKAMDIPDAYSRTLALATLFRDVCSAGMDGSALWNPILASASDIGTEWKREELLEKIASWGMKCGKDVNALPDMLDSREMRMKLLSRVVRLSDEGNMISLWELWSGRSDKDRYELLRMMVHNGFPADRAVELAEELGEERVEMLKRYTGGNDGNGRNRENEGEMPDIPELSGPEPPFTMALYNTYRGKASEVHYRSISRAAALCYAFDLKLALIGFPFGSAEECVERTVARTRIGDGSEYLRAIMKAGRLAMYGKISDIPGKIVATTPYPDPEKSIGTDDLSYGMIFLMGLGHDGLPGNVLESAAYHLEFTGRNASLETCTAMGVLAHMLHIRRST